MGVLGLMFLVGEMWLVVIELLSVVIMCVFLMFLIGVSFMVMLLKYGVLWM